MGALLFWLLSAWLVTVGLASLVPQIFGPAYSAAASGTSCAQDLHDLTRELLDRIGAHIKPACTEPERAAFIELSRLRHGMASAVERFAREELPHVRNLNALLNHASGVPPRN